MKELHIFALFLFDRITHHLILSGNINSQLVYTFLFSLFRFSSYHFSVDIYFLIDRQLHFFLFSQMIFFSSRSQRLYIGMIPTSLWHIILPPWRFICLPLRQIHCAHSLPFVHKLNLVDISGLALLQYL